MTELIYTVVPLALVLACPLMMIFMMKGMHGSGAGGQSMHGHQQQPTLGPPEERIAQLEDEVARLKAAHPDAYGRWEAGR